VQFRRLVAPFIGQQHILADIDRFVQADRAGLRFSKGPAVFVFYGPSGSGKSELSRYIASRKFDLPIAALEAQGKYVKFAMNAFQEEDASNFFGPREGLQGRANLFDALQQEPQAVILLDEIEKAHPDLAAQIGLSVFDDNGLILALWLA
jgi:ATP-dependent Clp protease ATP-binding subunit ClpB